ncbi:MAG: two-component system response regulator AtoC [Polyangiales bacterium]|jgi:two-component system response regulator AtoC
MTLLLTWSDRGAAARPSHRQARRRGDVGPVKRLVDAPENAGRYEHVIVLTTPEGRGGAADLVDDLRPCVPSAEVRVVELADPSNHADVFAAMKTLLSEGTLQLQGDIDVVLSAGTPQMQTIWVVLVKAGFLDARLLQVIPPAFVPNPHPHATREVHLEFEGFPEIIALRDEVERLRGRDEPDGIVGVGDAMAAVRSRIARVAPSNIPVVIVGETGVGKELVARAIHRQSERSDKPFVAENCGALSESVLESELFGHEKGAFTGAAARRMGLFERADGGTLFLDEVGELSPRVQSSLLRVLQEGRFRRVGGESEISVDVRVIGATHRDLRAMVRAEKFREDLYYRLAGVRIEVPPLRTRIEDLPALIETFQGADAPRLTGGARRALRRYRWPGNVRELRAEIRRWDVFCDDVVRESDLSAEVRGVHALPAESSLAESPIEPLSDAVQRLESEWISLALEKYDGNIAQSARALQIDRNTLKRKMKRMAQHA